MNEQMELLKTLTKKAKGFSADEIVEEYQSDADGNLTLSKRKVSTKYYPPDTSAIKSILEMDTVGGLSDEELEEERLRLLAELQKISLKNEERDEKTTK